MKAPTERERRERTMEDALNRIAYGVWDEGPPVRAKTCRALAAEALREIDLSRRVEEAARVLCGENGGKAT